MEKQEKLTMHTENIADANFIALAKMFPNAVTETIDENGEVVRAIDADVLAQEINTKVVSGKEECYQFTWPDKKKSMLLANAPIAATLRPCREESVDFDNTENLYIEGDNLDVLKLLRETYLNRVKMIYIDPPYNTGNDFIYEDDFAEDTGEFLRRDGQYDEQGNRLTTNFDSNGRFHTDWLNMMYPRLRVARDLLSDDGVIFISIDDNEVHNLRKICDDVFGECNFRNQIIVRRGSKSVQSQFETWDKLGQGVEYLLLYSKDPQYRFPKQMKQLDEERVGGWNNHWRGTDRPTMRYEIFGIIPESGQWRWGKERSELAIINYKKMLAELNVSEENLKQEQIDEWYKKQKQDIDLLRLSKNGKPEHYIPATNFTLLNNLWIDLLVGSSSEILSLFGSKVFDTAKLTSIIKRMLNFGDKNAIILDFFAGSSTTAHAVMQLNAEDGGNRKFIMVQIPEPCDEKSEAYKAGYKNICEIGKERIRRAGAKIKEENKDKEGIENLDTGFRVLKLDSSNMKEVYYTPEEYSQMGFNLDGFIDNIKPDRSDEDLLFQVMLDLGIPLSAKIEQKDNIFSVNDNYLIACFDKVDTSIITQIAKKQPCYAVFRDSSFINDSALVNVEQIFNTYSPNTKRRVL